MVKYVTLSGNWLMTIRCGDILRNMKEDAIIEPEGSQSAFGHINLGKT